MLVYHLLNISFFDKYFTKYEMWFFHIVSRISRRFRELRKKRAELAGKKLRNVAQPKFFFQSDGILRILVCSRRIIEYHVNCITNNDNDKKSWPKEGFASTWRWSQIFFAACVYILQFIDLTQNGFNPHKQMLTKKGLG